MSTKAQRDADDRRWSAAVDFVRAGGELKRLIKEKGIFDPETQNAKIVYDLALRKVKRYRVKGQMTIPW